MNELITIIEDDEYESSFNITVNRFPDIVIKFKYINCIGKNAILDIKTAFNKNKVTRILLDNYSYEDDLPDMDDVIKYNILISIDNIKNTLLSNIKGFDNNNKEKYSYTLSYEESTELINKLLDIGELIDKGEL